MKVDLLTPSQPATPLELAVGDEVIVFARGIVTGVEVELVDVTSFGSEEVPELIPGETTATVAMTKTAVFPKGTISKAAQALDRLRELGVDL